MNTFIAPTAMTFWKMTCDLGATPGAGNTRQFFLRAAATTSSALTCTIGNPKTSCTPTAGANSAPFSVSAGQSVNFMETATGTPAAATANCAGTPVTTRSSRWPLTPTERSPSSAMGRGPTHHPPLPELHGPGSHPACPTPPGGPRPAPSHRRRRRHDAPAWVLTWLVS